jgi:hypothetical protein
MLAYAKLSDTAAAVLSSVQGSSPDRSALHWCTARRGVFPCCWAAATQEHAGRCSQTGQHVDCVVLGVEIVIIGHYQ